MQTGVTEIISNLKWEPLERSRATQRLTFMYTSIHKLIAVDTESFQTKPTREGVSTRKHWLISFEKLLATKDCYYSLYPRVFPGWNCLLGHVRDAPTLGTFKDPLQKLAYCSVDYACMLHPSRGDHAVSNQNQNQKTTGKLPCIQDGPAKRERDTSHNMGMQ